MQLKEFVFDLRSNKPDTKLELFERQSFSNNSSENRSSVSKRVQRNDLRTNENGGTGTPSFSCHSLDENRECLSIVLYCIVLYRIVSYCIVMYRIVSYCIVLIVLYCIDRIVLYCIVLYCIVLYCIVLYCIVLYCILDYLMLVFTIVNIH